MMQAGHARPTTVPMGWMVSRALLAVMLLAAIGGRAVYADRAAAEPGNCAARCWWFCWPRI